MSFDYNIPELNSFFLLKFCNPREAKANALICIWFKRQETEGFQWQYNTMVKMISSKQMIKTVKKINIEQFVIKLNTCVDLAALRQ